MFVCPDVSLTDCTVWYYAKQNNYTLQTDDRKLRNVSLIDGVEVHGIIYVIDQLVEECLLGKTSHNMRYFMFLFGDSTFY